MKVNILELLDNHKTRIRLCRNFHRELFDTVRSDMINMSNKLKIHPKTLERKLLGNSTNSFTLAELEFILQKYKISESKICKNITEIKFGRNSFWTRLPIEIFIDENFIEGIGYYIGDGRMRTDKGLSSINSDIKTAKFFIKWLEKYFNIKNDTLKINIRLPTENFDINYEKDKWSKLLGVERKNITSVKKKYKGKEHHLPQIEICYHRKISKMVLDKLIPIIKVMCLQNKDMSAAYIRGIMAAEGSVKYNEKSHAKSIFLKMKDKTEIRYLYKLLINLGITPSFLFSKQDYEWLVLITGMIDLRKLDKIDVFRLNEKRHEKFKRIIKICQHEQVKKGFVKKFYLRKLMELEEKHGKWCTALQLSKYTNRDKSRTIDVLREFQKKGFIRGRRIRKTGRPFKFTLMGEERKFIS